MQVLLLAHQPQPLNASWHSPQLVCAKQFAAGHEKKSPSASQPPLHAIASGPSSSPAEHTPVAPHQPHPSCSPQLSQSASAAQSGGGPSLLLLSDTLPLSEASELDDGTSPLVSASVVGGLDVELDVGLDVGLDVALELDSALEVLLLASSVVLVELGLVVVSVLGSEPGAVQATTAAHRVGKRNRGCICTHVAPAAERFKEIYDRLSTCAIRPRRKRISA
jgi:hypothetical protein